MIWGDIDPVGDAGDVAGLATPLLDISRQWRRGESESSDLRRRMSGWQWYNWEPRAQLCFRRSSGPGLPSFLNTFLIVVNDLERGRARKQRYALLKRSAVNSHSRALGYPLFYFGLQFTREKFKANSTTTAAQRGSRKPLYKLILAPHTCRRWLSNPLDSRVCPSSLYVIYTATLTSPISFTAQG